MKTKGIVLHFSDGKERHIKEVYFDDFANVLRNATKDKDWLVVQDGLLISLDKLIWCEEAKPKRKRKND